MTNYNNAAIEDKSDSRDYCFEALGTKPLTDKDWQEGYDVKKVLGINIPVRNQGISYRCVGDAFAYYRAVLEAHLRRRYRDISPKSIYSLISLGHNRGAYLRDGAKTLKDLGALYENILPSVDGQGQPTEEWNRDKSWFNEEIKEIMELLKVSDYYRVTDFSMDGFAKAIRDGMGSVAGIRGTNNGTFHSAEPKPPTLQTPTNQIWGHAIYFGAFGIDDKGKYVEFLDSMGEGSGNKGWKKLREEWFAHNGKWIFNPWTLILKTNINNMLNESAKILKDKNSSAVGIWLPAISEDVMKSYALNMGLEVPMKDDKIDWDNFIQGEVTFK
jgi:hypothetical protein